MTDTRARIVEFLSDFLRDYQPDDDEDIFATGRVNSLVGMELIRLVEQEFGVPVEDEDLDLANFSSISAILRFIERKSTPADS